MDSPGNLPPTATQNHHDEHLKSKPCATNTNTHNQPKEYPVLVTKVTASNLTKYNPQKQISEQVTEENNKNDNGNNNTDPIISTNNDKNTVYNRRIEHTTIATVINNRFTTKSTLDIRPKNQTPSLIQLKSANKYLRPSKIWTSPQQLSYIIILVSQMAIHSQLTKNTSTSSRLKNMSYN